MSFNANVRHTGDVAIVDLSGRLTLGDGSGILRSTVKDLIDQGEKKILLNLKEITYIDSSGLGELVSSYASMRSAGGRIKLLNAEARIRDLLMATKIHTLFEDYTNEAIALISFSGSEAATA